jgi:hypothetical protein
MSAEKRQSNGKGIFDMAIVQGNMGRMRRKPIVPRENSSDDDLVDLKLHAAQEILAEVFGITVAEAEEMIKQRSKERMLWPERFQTDR